MATITLKGNAIHTSGDLPAVGSHAPDFTLTGGDLGDKHLADFQGKRKVLNIFPSIDTPVCALSVKAFNQSASELPNTVVLCISADLPFAAKRFCAAEGLENVVTLSTFRGNFNAYGINIVDGPLAGLTGRGVVVLNEKDEVIYTELVPEIAQEPNYAKALEALA